jgi:RND family efflux transporter MFP subunit
MADEGGGVSDAQLLERFASSRDEAAFELLVWRHSALVLGTCRRVLRDDHDAEDALQATFLALARKAGQICKREAVAGWLHKVALRAALTARARRLRRNTRERSIDAAAGIAMPVNRTAGEATDLREILDVEVNRLPDRFRAPVVLCYLEGKSVDEAAMQIGCPRGTVASRLARARERLRSRLDGRGFDLSTALAGVTKAPDVPQALIPVLSANTVIPTEVVTLTEEVLRAMLFSKLKTASLVLAAVAGVLLAGSGWVLQSRATAEAGEQAASTAQRAGDDKEPAPLKPAGPDTPKLKTVTVCHPVATEAVPTSFFPGRLEALSAVDIRAQIGGKLERVCFEPGADVKKGQVLFEIESSTYSAAVRQSGAEFRQAELHREHVAKMVTSGTEPLASLDAADTALRVAKADYAKAAHDLKCTTITAPLDGRITRSLVDPGNRVFSSQDNATLLATITQSSALGVVFDIDEQSFLRYRRYLREEKQKVNGGPILVRLSDETDYSHKGLLRHFEDRVDPKTGTIRAHGAIPNPEGLLLPGMFVEVKMALGGPRKVFKLPRPIGNPVFVVNEQGVIEQRQLVYGSDGEGKSFVQSGLKENDWVVIDGNSLAVGDHVKMKVESAAAKK